MDKKKLELHPVPIDIDKANDRARKDLEHILTPSLEFHEEAIDVIHKTIKTKEYRDIKNTRNTKRTVIMTFILLLFTAALIFLTIQLLPKNTEHIDTDNDHTPATEKYESDVNIQP